MDGEQGLSRFMEHHSHILCLLTILESVACYLDHLINPLHYATTPISPSFYRSRTLPPSTSAAALERRDECR